MRIGIEARRYGPGGRGQERYVRCLVHALAAADTDHEFLLLGHRRGRLAGELGPRARFVSAARRLRLQYRGRLVGVRRFLVRDLDLVHFPVADGWYRRVIPGVVTIHDLSALTFPAAAPAGRATRERVWRHHRAIAAAADAVIVDSAATGRDVVRLLDVPGARVEVVPLGVEPAFRPVGDERVLAAVRRRYAVPSRFLLFVGGTDFKKNVARLVEAYAIAVRSARLPHVLALAGDRQHAGNPFFDAARERAAEAGVAERVAWLGRVPDGDLPALYSAADAFVFPSLVEGFGLPVLEAMACGTPVLTSAGSAMEEVAGEAAVLADPWDAESIAGGVLDVLDEDRRAQLRDAGLRRAAFYTWERTAARTLRVYERVAAGESVRAGVVV